LRERLAVWPVLWRHLEDPDAIVLDPDSRLTQLGLLPVCEESRYFFFESRAYGEYGEDSLVKLTQRWLESTLGVPGTPYIAPADAAPSAMITVSLGVGENPQKRLSDPFEPELMALLAETGLSILIDKGGSAEEAERVERAIAGHENIRTWQGAFAPFASAIAMSTLYVGYDSAGQHVAAACGTPLLTVFAGAASPRMFHRWKPDGPGPSEVIRVDQPDSAAVLAQVRERLPRLLKSVTR
jgi:ADP-heptose:LPS heptosyltransferase